MDYKELFVGGDLSGIQSFLYNITSTKAAVSLKGRSDYLSSHMRDFCNKLIECVKNAGAVNTHEIYCSGGKFYFRTNNSEKIIEAVLKCTLEEEKLLFDEHKGHLGIAVAYVAFDEKADGTVDAKGGNHPCGFLWECVNDDFTKAKRQKFKALIGDRFLDFFSPIQVGKNPRVCALTGVESESCVRFNNESNSDGTPIYILPSVKEQIFRGKKISESNETQTFEYYAHETFLGVLRMDVDGLGARFRKGFKSISDYEAFSKRLTDFFEQKIKSIVAQEFVNTLDVIYAGGDDIFVVGQWDKTIELAEQIHCDVVKNFSDEGISISGGIAIVDPKFPIAKAAELAGDAEDEAKSFVLDDKKKNAISFLGRTVSWDGEYDDVKEWKERFVKCIDKFGLSKSILHKLMLYASIARKNETADDSDKDYSYIWHMAYYLKRFKEPYIENKRSSDKIILDLCDDLMLQFKNRSIVRIGLAARWAELELKENINN